MSNKSNLSRIDVLELLKGSGLLAVTITGILLYLFLSVPATFFYARLGVSPAEVGITYVSLLSGSTIEILTVLVILTAAFLLAAFVISLLSFSIRVYVVNFPLMLRLRRRANKTYWELTDHEFKRG